MLLPYETTKHRRPNKKTRIVIIATLVLLGLALGYQAVTGSNKHDTPRDIHGSLPSGCTRTVRGLYCNLTEQGVKEKAKGVTWYEKRTLTVKTTAYSRQDSCHNKRVTLCLTAIGKDTTEGRTIACPRDIKLGTYISLNGKMYICEDRTAEWVQKRNGPTFDIFMEDNKKAKRWGVRMESITIYKKI